MKSIRVESRKAQMPPRMASHHDQKWLATITLRRRISSKRRDVALRPSQIDKRRGRSPAEVTARSTIESIVTDRIPPSEMATERRSRIIHGNIDTGHQDASAEPKTQKK